MKEPVDIDPKSIAFLPYSSGTTGKPKGVKISHGALTNNMAMYVNEYITNMKPAEGDHQEAQLGILPFFHIYGMLATLLSSAAMGSKLVTLPKFDPTLFISTIKKHDFTGLQVVPTLLQFIGNCPMITAEDVKYLDSIIVGGAPVSVNYLQAVKEKYPNVMLQEGYGMTETLLTHVTKINEEKIGYCGHLLSNAQAKIIDIDTGDLLPAYTPGELCVKTPAMMSGYHNNEKATREVMEDGWLHTGDVAICTDDGLYSIVDRLKELIKVKGLQVSPSELEEAIQKHPGVADVGVVGVPHPRYGEVPAAFVIKADPDLKESSLHKLMEEHFTKHKQLDGGITFVDELPKNQMGKLMRRVLKAMALKKD
ncbi:UNVERIFIED_CONTAM: hypothetical protein GTU68_061632 [Idotea baltica]|nr:hypothetical protein [Idotea baltica]